MEELHGKCRNRRNCVFWYARVTWRHWSRYKITYPRGGHVVTRVYHRKPSQEANGREVTGSFVIRSIYLLQEITGILGGKSVQPSLLIFCLHKNVYHLHTIKIVDISKKDKVNPNSAAAVQRIGIFQKLNSEVLLFSFGKC